MKLSKSGKSEEESSEKKTNGWCPIASHDELEVPCQETCAWNQGDFCILYDLRNDLAGIRAALETVVIQNAEK